MNTQEVLFKRFIKAAVCTTLALAGAALLIGCGGLKQSPLSATATGQKSVQRASDSHAYIVFSTRGLDPSQVMRAAKPSGTATSQKVSETVFNRRGGSLFISFNPPQNAPQDATFLKRADFDVAKGSMDRELAEITMEVFNGVTLEDVVVKFGPSGLKFNPPAELTFRGEGKLDTKSLKAYHIEDDDSKSDARISRLSYSLIRSNGYWVVTVKVPGFSEYSLGDDFIPPQGEGP